jgi:hypothetical protein
LADACRADEIAVELQDREWTPRTAVNPAYRFISPGHGCDDHVESGQFVSLAFGQRAHAAVIAQWMGSTRHCYNNAVAGSFFATLKKQLIHRRPWPTKTDMRTEIRLSWLALVESTATSPDDAAGLAPVSTRRAFGAARRFSPRGPTREYVLHFHKNRRPRRHVPLRRR